MSSNNSNKQSKDGAQYQGQQNANSGQSWNINTKMSLPDEPAGKDLSRFMAGGYMSSGMRDRWSPNFGSFHSGGNGYYRSSGHSSQGSGSSSGSGSWGWPRKY